MKATVLDAGNLIACSACAKAKAKCDKRAQQQQKVASQTVSPPSSSTPSPPNQGDAPTAADESFQQLFPGSQSATSSSVQLTPFDSLQWSQPLLPSLNSCPGDLPIEPVDSTMHPFDTAMLNDTLFSAPDHSMDYTFTTSNLGMLPHSGTPTDPFLASTVIPGPSSLPLSPPQTWNTPPDSTPAGPRDEDWPAFRCNPLLNPERLNPRTGGEFLRRLEQTLNDQSVWKSDEFSRHFPRQEPHISVEPVSESLRDKIMVISQGFLGRAREVHRNNPEDNPLRKSSSSGFAGFFILPPPFAIEGFLRAYATRLEPYLPAFPAATISPTNLLANNDEKASILILLLMIAHGAMGSTMPEARYLSSGLIEICRICMFDVMERNHQLAGSPVMLRCCLLYLNAAAWSGNRWNMDLSAAQLRMYTSMLRYSRLLEPRTSILSQSDPTAPVETVWQTWQEEESQNRLTYSWVILDQEMNLFHDRQPDLDIGELNTPLPDSDELWSARSAELWHKSLTETGRLYDIQERPSLAKLFHQFMGHDLSNTASTLSFTELRLLLHPVQALIYHLNKSVVYMYNPGSHRVFDRLVSQLEEVQYLLKKWYTLSKRAEEQQHDSSEIGHTNMLMFHLISINAVTYFPDIERLARGELSVDEFRNSLWAGKRCVEEAAQIWCHCGQVIRHFRQMPASRRPYWWSATIYRVALCMWATSLTVTNDIGSKHARHSDAEKLVLDDLPFDHPIIVRYLRHQDGVPVLSGSGTEGAVVSVGSPIEIITYCIDVLRTKEPGSQLDEGISARLSALAERWRSR
ncbi:hypothetical protein BDV96DRAFT_596025 [Lophiotrema nucula]|uniref:Xylanolytic transcriptional activator regulatory domain-containing protein n=1 Tax=Lophiotrema nucula TaxID=690887 RepID=A0A6A5ZM11_9PLEO|nr:hypothetical protein BDV96DRAFT_596025 [Lophiotrema nucula]